MDSINAIRFNNCTEQEKSEILKEYLTLLLNKLEKGEKIKLCLFSGQNPLVYGYSDSDLLAILKTLKAFILKDVLDG